MRLRREGKSELPINTAMKTAVARWWSLRLATLSFMLVSLFSPVVAQQNASAGTAAKPAAAASSLAKDATALVTEFEVNGLKVLFKRREGSATVVAGLFIKGGARNITADNAGIENLMLDVSSEASANFPRERLRTQMARLGAAISSGVNYDYSVLSLASTRENFDRTWEMFTDVALRPAFVPEDVERVRNRIVLTLSDDADTPDSYLQVLQARVAYAGHPYINEPRGTVQSVSKLTADDLRRYHKKMMETSRLLLVVVGDFDAKVLRQKVAASFGKLPRGSYASTPLPALTFESSSVDVTERQLPTNYVQGVFSAPSLAAADIYPMRIASSILQTRVILEVRHKRNLSYAPDSFLWSQGTNLGGIYVTSTDANQSVRLMLDEIARLQREPISELELKGTVQHYLTRYYLGQESNAAQAAELAQNELIGGGWRNSMMFMDRLAAVTPADVQRVSQKYMRNLRFVVLGNPKSVDTRIFTGVGN